MNADGTDKRVVVAEPGIGETGPVWSPDGARLVHFRDGELYIVDVATSAVTQLTDTRHRGGYASSWALVPMKVPVSGEQIAFSTDDGIYTMDADGTDLAQLTNQADGWPVFSPDGTRIVFQSLDDGSIDVMNADGSNRKRLTNHAVE